MRRCVITNGACSIYNGVYTVLNNNIWTAHELAADPDERIRLNEGWNLATDPHGNVLGCDCDTSEPGNADTEKMLVVRVDSGVVAARREAEGIGFNLTSRRPEAYSRLVREPSGPVAELGRGEGVLRVLAISGSMRANSMNSGLLRACQRHAPAGVEVTLADIRSLPLYNQELDDTPPPAVSCRTESWAAFG